MADDANVRRLAAKLVRTEARLLALEAAPQLGHSSVDLKGTQVPVSTALTRGLEAVDNAKTALAEAATAREEGQRALADAAEALAEGKAAREEAAEAVAALDTALEDSAKAVEEAGKAVEQAQQAADDAVGAAEQAQTAHNEAVAAAAAAATAQVDATTANGRITSTGRTPTTADGQGKPDGALWYQYSTTGDVLGAWRWDGNTWTTQKWASSALADDIANDIQTALDDADAANGAAEAAARTAGNAQTAADGKNVVWYQSSAPAGSSHKVGDTWFDTSSDNLVNRWTGRVWSPVAFGEGAISDLAITNAKIANGTIQNAKIANLDAGKLTTGTLAAARIAAQSIAASQLIAGTITAVSGVIANAAITNAMIAAVDAGKITTGFLDAARIDANTINVNHLNIGDFQNLVDGSNFEDRNKVIAMWGNIVTSPTFSLTTGTSHTGTQSVVAAASSSGPQSLYRSSAIPVQPGDSFYVEAWIRLGAAANGTAGNSKIRVSAGSTHVASPVTWGATEFAKNTWTKRTGTFRIPDDATYTEIDVAIRMDHTSGNVWVDDIVMRRMTAGELLVDGAVSADKLAAESVIAGKVAAGAIATDNLQTNAVTAAKVAANAIATDSLQANSVVAAKIQSNAIIARHIQAGAVVTDKLDAAAVTAEKIAALAVTAEKIAARAITAEKIAVDAITAEHIAAGAIEAIAIAAGAIDGMTITGAILRSSASGQRVEILENRMDVYSPNNVLAGRVQGFNSGGDFASGQVRITAGAAQFHVGRRSLPAGGAADTYAATSWVDEQYVRRLQFLDTTWTNLNSYRLSGVSGNLYGRNVGGFIEIRGSVTYSQFSNGNTNFATLPEAWRPAVSDAKGSGHYSGGWPCVVGMSTAGNLTATLGYSINANGGTVGFSVLFLAG